MDLQTYKPISDQMLDLMDKFSQYKKLRGPNPSGLLKLKDYYLRGYMTEQEYLRLRKRYLGINVFTGGSR